MSIAADGWRNEETAHVVWDLGEADRGEVDAIMAEGWAYLRVARLVGLMRAMEDRASARIAGLEARVESLEAEIRSLRGE